MVRSGSGGQRLVLGGASLGGAELPSETVSPLSG